MKTVYFDSGTSNSRIYLLAGNNVLYRDKAAVGSRDSALAGDREVLVSALYKMYSDLLADNDLKDNSIDSIWMSGMISCPSGLKEVEHLTTPTGKMELAKAIEPYFEPVHFKREICLVPGLKTIGRRQKADLATVPEINNVRGEEVEAFGVLSAYPDLQKGCSVIVFPGSHTQVLIVSDGVISDIISNVTGELYAAILKNSIIGSSVRGGDEKGVIPKYVRFGARNVYEYGFNRALYIVRSMELFADTEPRQRYSALEGVINADVLKGIHRLVGDKKTKIVVAGNEEQYRIYAAIAEIYPNYEVVVALPGDDKPFSVRGVMELLRTVHHC